MAFCRYIYILAILASIWSPALSQSRGYRFEAISVEQGLSQTSVWGILQDRDGFLWFGTADGLNRYDGYSFSVFRHDPRDSASLADNNVASLDEDRDGNFWFGSRTGLGSYNRSTGVFSRLGNDPRYTGTFLDSFIVKVLVDRAGLVWVGTQNDLACLNPVTGIFRTLPQIHKFISVPNNIRPLMEDSDGDLWVGTLHGFLIVRLKSGTIEEVTVPGIRDAGFGMTAFQTRDGTIWLGTSKCHLISYRKKENVWRKWSNLPDAITGVNFNSIRSICEDDAGQLWMGTQYTGLFILDRTTETFTRFTPGEQGKSNTRYEGVIQIYRDRSGLLWIGYDGAGIVKINPHPDKFPLVRFPLTEGSGTGDNFFKSIMVDHDGLLWAGTFDKGIKLLDRRTGSLKTFTHSAADNRSLRNNTVLSLYEDRRGRVWVGTLDGVDLFDRRTTKFRHLEMPAEGRMGAAYLAANSICEDRQGTIWIGSTPGLIKYDSTTSRLVHIPVRDNNGTELRLVIERLTASPEGGLWVGTNGNGLVRVPETGGGPEHFVHENDNPNSLSHNGIKSIWIDQRGVLWIGTWEGLDWFNPAENTWKRFYQRDGLANDFVYGVLQDKSGQIWMSTNRGLCRMDAKDIDHPHFRNYSPEDGLQSYEFNTGAYFLTNEGELLFGGVNGINAFFPDSVRDNPNLPPIVFTGFKKFDQPVRVGKDLNSGIELLLNYTESVFSFEFAALEYTSPSRNQYSYRMEGFDPEWIRSGTRREARYTNLSPGSFTFRVRGSNNDNVWNDQGASLTLHILPPWWRTWWAYSAYALGLTVSAMGTRWLARNWKIILASKKSQYVSHFRLLEQLGEGGMGRVYKASDTTTKQTVALKVLNPALLKDAENRKRLMNEGQLLSSFSHPNIVKVYEVSEAEDLGFIAMEFLAGGTLKQSLETSHPLNSERLKHIILQVCSGLSEIHSHGIIHRDVKTGNIMLDEAGNIRIMDFGLSKSPLVTTMTTLGTVIGTLGYVAPEQVTGMNVDERVDIFSFGVVLYELLTNRLPFKGENEIAVIHSIFNTIPPPPSSISPGISTRMDEIVSKCLAKSPDDRFRSMHEVRIALEKEFS